MRDGVAEISPKKKRKSAMCQIHVQMCNRIRGKRLRADLRSARSVNFHLDLR